MCQENVSATNGVGFLLLVVASLLCSLSFSAPFWIHYPDRHGVPNIKTRFDSIRMVYPFKMASWRGLWAVCFKQHIRGHVADQPFCAWFWQKDFSLWKTIPSRPTHVYSRPIHLCYLVIRKCVVRS